MTTNQAKIGTIAVALVSTWTTAHADDFRVTVSPDVTIDNVQIYSERLPNGGIGGQARDNTALTANFGTLTAGSTLTRTVSTAYGTSTADNTNNDYANFSVVATTSTAGVVVGGGSVSGFNFNDAFSGLSQPDTRAAIVAGNLAGVVPLFRRGGQFDNSVFGSRQQTTTQTGGLFNFDANGNYSRIGSFTITPQAVPEPTTLAALSLGAVAMLRRRKRA